MLVNHPVTGDTIELHEPPAEFRRRVAASVEELIELMSRARAMTPEDYAAFVAEMRAAAEKVLR